MKTKIALGESVKRNVSDSMYDSVMSSVRDSVSSSSRNDSVMSLVNRSPERHLCSVKGSVWISVCRSVRRLTNIRI